MNETKTPKVTVIDVFKYFWQAARPQKWSVYYTLFAFGFTGVLHIIIPLIYKEFFDLLASGGSKTLLGSDLIKLIIYVLILNGIIWLLFRTAMIVLNSLESKTMARIKQTSFDHMIRHSYSFFANNFVGSLVQKINRFSRSFERLYDNLIFNLIPLVVNVAGVVIVVYIQEPIISYIIFAWVLIILTVSYVFYRWKLKYDLRSAKADSTTTALLADSLSNQYTIASFNGFFRETRSFKETTNNQASAQQLAWNLSAIMDAIQSGLIIIVEFLIFYYAVKFWQRDIISLGTFVLIQAYILGLAQRLWNFSRIVRNVYEGVADSKEMVEILMTEHEVKDLPNPQKLVVTEGEVEFKNVVFNYNETRPVVDDINLKIKGGEKVALIGPSGAGKSTLVKLLLRTYDLTGGLITIDGQDIKYTKQDDLRDNISLVPQDPILFHRTLMENIRYGRKNATDDEVIEAARLAHCDEFIEVLPLKYETYVGERGIKLSGGERQRVAIARAILKNAPILMLDEATSSLDSHSESLIQDALDKLMKGKTSIVIAHRLSTINKMDRIIVVDNGKIVEEGGHQELIGQKKSLYKKLWDLQAGGFMS